MAAYRPSIKTLPIVFLAILGILYIYDVGLEQEKIKPEIVLETLTLPPINNANFQTKNIHTVQEGENLSLIF